MRTGPDRLTGMDWAAPAHTMSMRSTELHRIQPRRPGLHTAAGHDRTAR
jgi:hypothetical protein